MIFFGKSFAGVIGQGPKMNFSKVHSLVWGKLWQLKQFETKLFKMLKNASCFTFKALFVLKIFKFLSWFFGHVEKRFYEVNFKICDNTTCRANNCSTRISQYLKKWKQAMKFIQLIEYNTRNIFLKKSYQKMRL